jgi:UV DNA damage repair endonuclease
MSSAREIEAERRFFSHIQFNFFQFVSLRILNLKTCPERSPFQFLISIDNHLGQLGELSSYINPRYSLIPEQINGFHF